MKTIRAERNQQGVALVSVLITVAIIVGLVSSLGYQQYLGFRRTGQILHTDQAIMYLMATEAFAKVLLNLDAQQNDYDYYDINESWMTPISNQYDGGTIESTLIELNGRMNVNNLRRIPTREEINSGKQDVNLSSQWQPCYKHVLSTTISATDEARVQTMIESLEDWLDEDVVARTAGAEDAFYSSVSDINHNYKTPNGYVADTQELALVQGYRELFRDDPTTTNNLLRHITAIPLTKTKVNINTATNQVLSCLDAKSRLTTQIADRIIERRQTEPFTNINDLYSLLDQEFPITEEKIDEQTKAKKDSPVPWKSIIPSSMIQVSSTFFMMRSKLKFGVADITAFTTFQRTKDGGVRVVRRVINSI